MVYTYIHLATQSVELKQPHRSNLYFRTFCSLETDFFFTIDDFDK